MKKNLVLLFVAVLALALTGCRNAQGVAYFQNAKYVDLSSSKMLYDAKIMPKDELVITVSTTDPSAATPFNLAVSQLNTTSASSQLRLNTNSSTFLPYLVDNEGNIDFPIIGKLHVCGLTKNQCQDLIRSKVKMYMSETENPIVTVRMSSYRITVMGEVNHACVVPVSTEKISVLEALAQAGDLSIYGRRDNVLIIREDNNGQKSLHRLDLNDANIINDPYYYLQQNDVVYVEPNKTKARNSDVGTSTSTVFSLVGIMTSVASLLVNILRK